MSIEIARNAGCAVIITTAETRYDIWMIHNRIGETGPPSTREWKKISVGGLTKSQALRVITSHMEFDADYDLNYSYKICPEARSE